MVENGGVYGSAEMRGEGERREMRGFGVSFCVRE